jgi:hypothetical protein
MILKTHEAFSIQCNNLLNDTQKPTKDSSLLQKTRENF